MLEKLKFKLSNFKVHFPDSFTVLLRNDGRNDKLGTDS